MKDQKISLVKQFLIGEVRQPVVKTNYFDDKVSTLSFKVENILVADRKDLILDINDKFKNLDGTYRPNPIFENAKALIKSGAMVVIVLKTIVTVKDDRIYVNYFVDDVQEYLDSMASDMKFLFQDIVK